MMFSAKGAPNYLLIGVALVLSIVPIFFLSSWVPTLSQEQAVLLDYWLDDHLFGRIGVWSSNFPLMSKAVANYVAIIAPLCSIALTVHVCRHHLLPLARLPVLTWRRQLLFYAGWFVLTALILDQNYFGYTDFAHHRAKFRWVGNHSGLYPIFASMMLLALQFVFVFSYVVLVHYPLMRLARRRAVGKG